jgi:uncharacterized protein (DUF58 family)
LAAGVVGALPTGLFEFVVFVFMFVAAGVEAGVLTGATLVTLALLAGLLALTLTLADSPQAIPRALRPRTVESTITFFISKKLLIYLKELNLFPGFG